MTSQTSVELDPASGVEYVSGCAESSTISARRSMSSIAREPLQGLVMSVESGITTGAMKYRVPTTKFMGIAG